MHMQDFWTDDMRGTPLLFSICWQRVYPESPYQPSKSNQEILLWLMCLNFDLFIIQHKEIHHSLCPQAVRETLVW